MGDIKSALVVVKVHISTLTEEKDIKILKSLESKIIKEFEKSQLIQKKIHDFDSLINKLEVDSVDKLQFTDDDLTSIAYSIENNIKYFEKLTLKISSFMKNLENTGFGESEQEIKVIKLIFQLYISVIPSDEGEKYSTEDKGNLINKKILWKYIPHSLLSNLINYLGEYLTNSKLKVLWRIYNFEAKCLLEKINEENLEWIRFLCQNSKDILTHNIVKNH